MFAPRATEFRGDESRNPLRSRKNRALDRVESSFPRPPYEKFESLSIRHSNRILSLLAFSVASAATLRAQSVSLFGQSWQVQRFDYQQQVTWPNPTC